jgi:hypothetical protein
MDNKRLLLFAALLCAPLVVLVGRSLLDVDPQAAIGALLKGQLQRNSGRPGIQRHTSQFAAALANFSIFKDGQEPWRMVQTDEEEGMFPHCARCVRIMQCAHNTELASLFNTSAPSACDGMMFAECTVRAI